MDFWAIWCGPCREMDDHLWNHEEMVALSDNFIPLKVDIDRHRDLAQKYAANAIPKVIIADANGTAIWEEVGFQYANRYLDIFKSIPTDLSKLNKCLIPLLHGSEEAQHYFNVGIAYQEVSKQTDNTALRSTFLQQSSSAFKQAQKNSADDVLVEQASLNLLLNDAYAGKTNRALKKVGKLKHLTAEASEDLKRFIQAYCYQCEGQTQAAQGLMAEIKNQKYLAELKELP